MKIKIYDNFESTVVDSEMQLEMLGATYHLVGGDVFVQLHKSPNQVWRFAPGGAAPTHAFRLGNVHKTPDPEVAGVSIAGRLIRMNRRDAFIVFCAQYIAQIVARDGINTTGGTPFAHGVPDSFVLHNLPAA